MGVGDSDVNILLRAFFARAVSLKRPPALDVQTAAVIKDVNSLVRGIELMGQTIDGVEPEPWTCQTMGDVLQRIGNRVTSFFMQNNARCVVLSLDQCSPVAKQIEQVNRKKQADADQARTGREPYRWTASQQDDVDAWFSDDMLCNMTWGDIFYHATAKRRFQEYVTRFLIYRYRMPIERTLILDGMVLQGERLTKPILLQCDSSLRATASFWPDHPPRWNYSESDWRIGFWLQELANAQVDEPILVVEDDFDVLHLMLQVERSLLWAYGARHTPIYVQRRRQFWDAEENRYRKVPEYIDLGMLYRDISWLFGSVLVRNTRTTFHSDPVDVFTSLILLRGDDYSQQLKRCTIKRLWQTFFEHGHELAWFAESPTRPSHAVLTEEDVRALLARPVEIRLHFSLLRAFVDMAYKLPDRVQKGTAVVEDDGSSAASSSASSRKRKAPATSKRSTPKRPAGWPDDTQLQVMAANMAWNLDNLANGWRLNFRSENELQTRISPADGKPISYYGWERRQVEEVDRHGEPRLAMRVFYADRVLSREVIYVEHGVQPVQVSS